jgi:hypothetical protein
MVSPPIVDARWELVQRVAASPFFHRSPRMRELLLYICGRALHNRPEDLREALIGQNVFGRKPDYSPGDDNIVRVEVRHLRKRLDGYFASEGSQEPILITIPKGTYVPVFEPRPAIERVMPAPEVASPRPLWPRIQAVAIGVLALAVVWLWIQNRSLEQAASAGAMVNRSPLWSLLFNRDHQTYVVCADSALVFAHVLTHHGIALEDYMKRDYGDSVPNLSAEVRSVLDILPKWQFTDVTDVRLVDKLLRLNAKNWDTVSIRSARTVQIQDFKNGNAVLLGSVRSNPWNKLFEPQLNFQFDFEEPTRTPIIRNKTPLAGEQPVYRAATPGDSGEVFSTVALVPNLRHNGYVLIVAGTTSEGTETAGDFIANPEASGELIRTLMARNNSQLPFFEVLLKSSALAGVTKNAEVVAFRIIRDQHPAP